MPFLLEGPKNPNDKSDEKPSTSAKKIKKCGKYLSGIYQ